VIHQHLLVVEDAFSADVNTLQVAGDSDDNLFQVQIKLLRKKVAGG
jgi:hypothetical protein